MAWQWCTCAVWAQAVTLLYTVCVCVGDKVLFDPYLQLQDLVAKVEM